ncbi:MAG: undecaprenyl-phosphate glucose phosphotransferase [Candidatus Caenarcaniphilales bacterium]|nr:undecaprenyl-phosphate glucose phosphotransferase [Candidatus Caenarcaniphilales bacterium]
MTESNTKTILSSVKKSYKANLHNIDRLRGQTSSDQTAYKTDAPAESLLPFRGILSPDKKNALLIALQQLADVFLVNLSLYVLRETLSIPFSQYYICLHSIVSLAVAFIFYQTYLYRSWRGSSPFSHLPKIYYSWGLVLVVLLAIGYFTKTTDKFSRMLTLIWFTGAPLLIFAQHWFFRHLAGIFRQAGYNSRQVVFVGAGQVGQYLASQIQNSSDFGMQVVGFFDDKVSEALQIAGKELPFLGNVSLLKQYVAQNKIDIVYIAFSLRHTELIHEIVQDLKDLPVSVYLVPDIYAFDLLGATVQEVAGIPVIGLRQNPIIGENMLLKRCFDLIFSGSIIFLLSPLLALIALGIKLTSPEGPIIFKQRRHGIRGEEIIVYKFRTMKVCEDGPDIKQAQQDDDRVTPFGAFLRKSSLDELPQFFNVLEGTMSVVGPRPHALAHNHLYAEIIDGYNLRHLAKPGITGWAQVNGYRGETSRVEDMLRRVEYDLHYLHNWSLWLDTRIIFLTIWQFTVQILHLKKEKMAY